MDKYNQQHTFHHPTKYNKLFLREREGKIESRGGGAEVGGERISSRLHNQSRSQHGARSHTPEIRPPAEI